MAFISAHGSITAAQVATTASIVGQYTKLRVACTGGSGFFFSFDSQATNNSATSAFCSFTATGNNAWEFVRSSGAVLPASITTTVSLYASNTGAQYSITGY